MSRSRRFFSGLLSGYALIGVNFLYTALSIPLALHYLGKEQFGLWVLVMQLSGYLTLLDFGMSTSVARFLADHKDETEGSRYGSILKTGHRVFLLQGLAVAVLGLVLSALSPSLLAIPEYLHFEFIVLMSCQSLVTALGLGLRIFGSPLWAHQRNDISNLSAGLSFLFGIVVLWLGFHSGLGIYSMTISAGVSLAINLLLPWLACKRLGFYPKTHSGSFDARLFQEMFGFGKDLFLMNLGAQMTSASQVVIVSRMMGLEAASVWAISTKAFTMALQFVGRILDFSAGGLTEIAIRGDKALLHRRFRDIVSITGTTAAAGAGVLAFLNGPIIEVWTGGKISWPNGNNLLLAFLIFTTCVTRCHSGLVGINKDIRGMKFIFLAEGIVFILLGICLGMRFGFAGILIASLLSNVVITGAYSIFRTSRFFAERWKSVVGWVAHPGLIFLLIGVLFAGLNLPIVANASAIWRLFFGAFALLALFFPALFACGMAPQLRNEILQMAHSTSRKLSARFIAPRPRL